MAEEPETPGAPHLEPLSILWRVVAAPQTLMVLLGLIALALVAGSLIPQVPPQAVADPQAWLANQSGFFSRQSGLVRALGLFELYRSWWFRLLLTLTGLTLFVWTVEAAGLACLAWRLGRGHEAAERWAAEGRSSAPSVPGPWFGYAPLAQIPSPLPVEETLSRLRDRLARSRYRWAGLSVPGMVAVRRGGALWAQPAAWAALLVALLGLWIVGTWGWQGGDWQPAPGEVRAVGPRFREKVRLEGFDLHLAGDGRLQDYRSEIAWLEGELVARRAVVRTGQPALFRGIAVRQVGYVPAVTIHGQDAAGHPLLIQAGGAETGTSGTAEIEFPSPEAEPLLYLPVQDLFLALTFEPLDAEGRPALHLDLLQEGETERQPLAVLHGSGSVTAGDLRLELEVTYRPILRLDYRPAMGLVVGGLVLAVVALAIGQVASPRLVGLLVSAGEGNGSVIQLLVPAALKEGCWPEGLAARLGEALTDGD